MEKKRKGTFELSRSQWISVAILASSIGIAAAVTIPNTFTAGTTISAAQVNDNFAALATEINTLRAGGGSSTGGILLAAAHIQVANTATPFVSRSFSNLPSPGTVTVTRLGAGDFEVDFGTSVTSRYYMAVQGNATQGSPAGGPADVSPQTGKATALRVRLFSTTGPAVDTNFYVQIF
jgi:hypothetical protein